MSAKPRTNAQALARYQKFLQLSLSCVSNTVWRVGRPVEGSSATHVLTTAEEPIRLRSRDGGLFYLAVAQDFHFYTSDGERRAKTDRYSYTLALKEDLSKEFVLWHWHPQMNNVAVPDIHIGGRVKDFGDVHKLHVPTGRVSFERVVRFIIEELRVRAARSDWDEVLTDVEDRFTQFRSWG